MYTNRSKILTKFPDITEGKVVYSKTGDKLGKVVSLGEDYFIIEKGIFFPKDFTARYDDIEAVRGGEVYIAAEKADLADWQSESFRGWQQTEAINENRLAAQPKEEFKDRYAHLNVPVYEENLEAKKTMKQTGEVGIRKIVHTEHRHFTIPVLHEEVKVDRVPMEGERATETSTTDTEAFKGDEIRVPVMEEEVTISKRPVVKEEIRVSKERVIEDREIEGDVRSEEVEIDEGERLRRKKAG